MNVALEKTDDSLDIILGQIKFTLTAYYFNEDGNALTPNAEIAENAYKIQELNHITVTISDANIPTDATKTIILNGKVQDATITEDSFTIYANNSYLLNGKNSLILQIEYNGIISEQEINFTLTEEAVD